MNLAVDLKLNSKVVSIAPDTRTVTTQSGEAIAYDKLVLAHGGDLFIPPIEGIRNAGVFSCKQLQETLKLKSHAGRRAVVIGSGAIGIEAAEALKMKGYAVTIIELLDWILPALFDEATARHLEGPYTIHQGPLNGGQIAPVITEGPAVMPDPLADRWLLLYDFCMSNGYGISHSTDLIHWTKEADFSFPPDARHGSVFRVTPAEAAALRDAFERR